MRIAIVIGHKKDSPGAVNVSRNLTEFDYNQAMAKKIKEICDFKYQDNLGNPEDEIVIVYRDTYKGLPDKIDALNPKFIISLHCNAFNKKASGSEVLYYVTSKKGKQMAEIIQKQFVKTLGLPDRGTLPRDTEDRGGYLLRYTNAPCVIAEPFFIDNDNDLSKGIPNAALAEAYVRAIREIRGLF